MNRIISFGFAMILAASPAFAQNGSTARSNVELPEIQENELPESGEETGMMAGDKPFSLTTALDGELLYNFNEETMELESLTAKKGVVFTSEDMTLNSDRMDYRTDTSEIVATGRKVVVRQGELIATCQVFKYNPDSQKSEFTGSPIIYNKTKDGEIGTVVGDRITIETVNGKPIMKVHGMGRRAPGLQQGNPGQMAPVPAGSGNARLSINENGVSAGRPSGAIASGSSTPAGAPQTEPANTTGGGALSLPSIGGGVSEKSKPATNAIDLNNPEELESFSR